MPVLALNNKSILLDEEGYKQFLDELERLKLESLLIATKGSEEYENAVGDGWHDNFAFEESMRESRTIASKISRMLDEKEKLKIIKRRKLSEDIINLGDVIKVKIIYSDNDFEVEILKLTGKYIPNTEMKIKEISLNSPLGKTIFEKQIGSVNEYKVNDKVIKVKVLEKVE